MKSRTEHSERGLLDELRSDCKRWRRLVSKCAQVEDFVPPSTEEQYRIVHDRILAICCKLAEKESLPESRRRVVLQLDELLRPWTSTKSLKEAPANVVSDLLNYQTTLAERLRDRSCNWVVPRLKKLALTACLAVVGGIFLVLLLQSTNGNPSTPLFQSLQSFLTNIATYLGRTTITEQFAVAVFFSWMFGTWLLSRLSKS